MEIPKKSTRQWGPLFLSLLSFFGLCFVILTFPPGTAFSVFKMQISYLFIFFPLLFLCIYGLGAFFLQSALQGIMIALLINCFLFFRLINLTHPFFTILLVVLFFSLEAVVWRKR